jgi:hypothetical protein
MRLENDKVNELPKELNLVEDNKYKESVLKAKKEKEEFLSKQPLIFPGG